MKSHYAGYCIEIGYTAELVQSWYDSAEAEETSSVTSESETLATSTVVSTTTEEEGETSTTEASTSEKTEEATTSTSTSVATETSEDGGRGLPHIDFEGDDAEDGASMSRGGLIMLGVAPVVALLQWM